MDRAGCVREPAHWARLAVREARTQRKTPRCAQLTVYPALQWLCASRHALRALRLTFTPHRLARRALVALLRTCQRADTTYLALLARMRRALPRSRLVHAGLACTARARVRCRAHAFHAHGVQTRIALHTHRLPLLATRAAARSTRVTQLRAPGCREATTAAVLAPCAAAALAEAPWRAKLTRHGTVAL